ncbi:MULTISPECIES: molybdate ABC transporter permease subunit [unclassified Thauera]|uniref:molybdate ABC transporter permease subunit n=1 Tax=unclassified Thauera TaxID=2609274 RepID=UPI0002CFAE46|nr:MULTISPECIES: molybdate ABC transporter permease subunit [unclassified Thauera]ENO75115.1 Molybdenum transport system permease protein ModB [Thauera sp. 27]WBL64004.1 molybdate ABC transporter permease subunit [Thauera sp. WB-2]HRJ24666.1 molybdate ABC transporter permease subunit [Thauera sp.]
MLGLGPQDWQAIEVTFKLCLYTTLILLVIATPLAWWLAAGRSNLRTAVQAVVALPLVLPPTVLGFYLLVALGPRGFVGSTLEGLGLSHLAFSFEGILLASVLYSMPFAVQPLHEAFSQLGRRPVEVASALGANAVDRFLTVVLPLTRGGFVVAFTLTFAHTLGEFGVILMLGGSIPGETKVLSVLIYDHAEALNYDAAHRLSLGLLVFSFLTLFVVYAINRRFRVARVG